MENDNFDYLEERDALGQIKSKVPFTASDAIVEQKQGTPLNVVYASLGSRMLAYFLDALILLLPSIIIIGGFMGEDFVRPEHAVQRNLLSLLIWTLYYGVLDSSDAQATFGKRILGIQVTDEHGGKVSFLKAALQYPAHFLSVMPLGFGIWAIATDDQKQAWHDSMLGTLVIKKDNNSR